MAYSRTDDAAGIGGGPLAGRRIDRHHHPLQLGSGRYPFLFDPVAPEQGGGIIVDQFRFKLLAAEPRALVAFLHLGEEAFGEMAAIIKGRGLGLEHPRIADQLLQERDRPRRGRHHDLRIIAQSQSELQHVPGGFGIAPFRQLVAPGGVELRPAKLVGLLGRKDLRHGTIGPGEEPLRRRESGAPLILMDGEQPRQAFDHHLAGII
jgi:hypothetical protein